MPDPISCKQAEMPSRHGAADHNIETELLAIENERLRAEVRTLRSALKAAGRVIGSYRPTQRRAAAALIFNGVVCTCEARSAHPSAPTRRASSGPGLATTHRVEARHAEKIPTRKLDGFIFYPRFGGAHFICALRVHSGDHSPVSVDCDAPLLAWSPKG
jgi:hypothetical protein